MTLGTDHADAVRQAVENLLQIGLVVLYTGHLRFKGLRHAIEAPTEFRQFVRSGQLCPRLQIPAFERLAGTPQRRHRPEHTTAQ